MPFDPSSASEAPAVKESKFDPSTAKEYIEPNFYEGVKETVSKGRGAAIPFLMGGAGELVKGAGAVGELFTEKAKPVTELGEKIVKESKEFYPKQELATVGGQAASYALPFEAARGGIQAARGAKATGLLGKTAETGAAGGITGAATTPGNTGDRALAAGLGISLGIAGEAIPGLYRSGKEFLGAMKSPAPFGEVKSFKDIGQKIRTEVAPKVNAAYEARAKEAEDLYGAALSAAREKQALQPFAQSSQGQALLQSLERDKYAISGGKTFLKGDERVKAIDGLIDAIKGKTTGGETVPLGKGQVTSKLTKKTPTTTLEKDIEAPIEELRFMRSKDPTSKPAEKYAALQKEYRDQLVSRLERSLYDWNPQYKVADQAYRDASQKLNAFQTEKMSRALRGEKFDFKQLAASDEELGKLFFQDSKGVQNLKAVTDPQTVTTLAKDYASSIFSGKSPVQIQTFANDANNVGWMKEAGINDAVQKYAKEATAAADKKEIAKKLGFYSAATFVGYKGAQMFKSGAQALQ